jgi:hypothetical protein
MTAVLFTLLAAAGAPVLVIAALSQLTRLWVAVVAVVGAVVVGCDGLVGAEGEHPTAATTTAERGMRRAQFMNLPFI